MDEGWFGDLDLTNECTDPIRSKPPDWLFPATRGRGLMPGPRHTQGGWSDGSGDRPYSDTGRFGPTPFMMTPGVKWLLIVMVAIYVVQSFGPRAFTDQFDLRATVVSGGEVWRVFTYMFLHAPDLALHLLMNGVMLALIGPFLEVRLGTQRFLGLVIVSGILAGLFHLLVYPSGVDVDGRIIGVVGFSGALSAVIICMVSMVPQAQMGLLFLPGVRIRAWMIGAFLGVMTTLLFLMSVGGMTRDNVAHDVHFAGGLVGLLFAVLVVKVPWAQRGLERGGRSRWSRGRGPDLTVLPPMAAKKRRAPKKSAEPRPPTEEEINRILDKINETGFASLTQAEKDTLDQASKSKNRV